MGNKVLEPATKTEANTLQNWRPHTLIYFYFALAVILLAAVCSWCAVQCYPRVGVADAAVAGAGLFLVVLWLSLRRCSSPVLPSFRGLLLITAYMTIGMGHLSLLIVIPAVVFAILAVIAIALVSLLRNDTVFAQRQFRRLLEFYRRHRMYQ